jgi:hypothetical protein
LNEFKGSVLRKPWIVLLAAATFSAVCFALDARIGFNIWDEGFLWYGVRQVMAGEVPVRDFMSYDIGRYYLAAAVMVMLHDDGILALRLCLGLVQTFGVVLATYLVVKNDTRQRLVYSFLVAGIFIAWIMVTPYKNFDTATSILLIAALAFPLSRPEPSRWFIAGAIIGIAAMFGRNHGLYGGVAAMGVLIYVYWRSNWRQAWRAIGWISIGLIVGYLPNLVMLAWVRGFASAFWDSIALIFEHGATNLALPIPWPWIAFSRSAPPAETLRAVLVGAFFVAFPIFGVGGLIYAAYLRGRRPSPHLAVFTSAALLAIPYAHYAYSRADLAHLSFGVFPLLIGLLVWPKMRRHVRLAGAALLLVISVFVALPYFPVYQAARDGNWRMSSVGNDVLTIAPPDAEQIALLERVTARYACGNRSVFVTPFWPGAYAVLRRKAPEWEIYALLPRNVAFQEAEIARIKAADPGLAVIIDLAIDGRQELRYKNTHPMIERFIRDNFNPVKDPAPAYLQIYARDDVARKCS